MPFFIYVSCDSRVEHYRVKYTPDNKLTVDDDCFFENLTKLVQVGDKAICKPCVNEVQQSLNYSDFQIIWVFLWSQFTHENLCAH